ncbi:MAG: hypothetical protein JWO83_3402 [Caulobacteraceae bacterium]|nr:hypothetical protein [Caulobacteraceae bacterium]
MHKMSKLLASATIALAALVAASSASALVNGNILITVDENGHGTINGFFGPQPLPSALQNDPGPGGLNNVLTYDMLNPPGLVAGDVLLQDGPGGPILDVLRFNPQEVGPAGGTGSLLFYSDNIDGFDSLGDTAGPPGLLYANNITIPEVGAEGFNGAIYTPVAGQPGFVAGAGAPVEYVFISDSVPEPAAWALLLLGVGAVGAARRSQRKTVLA